MVRSAWKPGAKDGNARIQQFASWNDLRSYVRRRKISAGTRSDAGRTCRDAFHAHMKTCARHGISFWNYLGDRLAIPGADRVPWLPDLARQVPRSAPLPVQ